jgi:hypothetical protein
MKSMAKVAAKALRLSVSAMALQGLTYYVIAKAYEHRGGEIFVRMPSGRLIPLPTERKRKEASDGEND